MNSTDNNFVKLPVEAVNEIAKWVEKKDQLALQSTCKSLYTFKGDSKIWELLPLMHDRFWKGHQDISNKNLQELKFFTNDVVNSSCNYTLPPLFLMSIGIPLDVKEWCELQNFIPTALETVFGEAENQKES